MNTKRKTLKMPVRYLMNLVLVGLLFVGLSYVTGNMLSTYQNKVLLTVGINIILAVSLNVATGYLGQLPLGHAGFMAVGAYACALFTKSSGLPKGVAFAIGLVLDYSLENNMVLQRYWQPEFQKGGFIRSDKVREYSDRLIAQYDVRSGQGSSTIVRSMSGGNQQKAIIAREIDRDPKLLIAVQPTRGLDVGAIEYIHKQIVAERDKGTAVLLVSLELDEVMNLSDRILVMYEGEIVGEFDPKAVTVEELGLYMAGAKRDEVGK